MTGKTPRVAVDCVVFDKSGRLLLIRRRNPPFAGQFALPGGFVDYGESTEAAVRRELLEETGLAPQNLRLVGVYSDPHRDPRGHTIGIAYLAVTDGTTPRAGDDAADAVFRADWRALNLAFDHRQIAGDAARLLSGEQR
jgi:8-oxo-dGTP diphosphatase